MSDDAPLFNAALVITATAYATHPEGADVPAAAPPADEPDVPPQE